MAAGRPREFDYDKALEQAMHVFWRKGYEGTSMPDLTEAMGMNRPSIYSAFGNKEELFRKALERYAEHAEAYLKDVLKAPKLRDAITQFLEGAATSFSCSETPSGCMAVQGALACSDEAEAARLEALSRREDVVKLLVTRFEQAIDDKELPKGTEVKELARFYTTILHGMAVQSSGGISPKELKGIVKRALSILPA